MEEKQCWFLLGSSHLKNKKYGKKSLKLNCLNEPFTSQKGSAIIYNNTRVTKHSHLEILESSLINECEQPEMTKQNSVLKIALTLSVQKFERVNNEKNTFLRIRIGRKMGGLLFQKCSGGIKLRIIHNTTSCWTRNIKMHFQQSCAMRLTL